MSLKIITNKSKVAGTIIALAFLLVLPSILYGQLPGFGGADSFFHISRYMDTAMQIKTGHYSFFQQFFTLNNSGKIVNALYGPLVAYFQGLLLNIVHFNGIIWWYLYLFQINLIGIGSMYWLQRENGVAKKKSLMLGILFVVAGNVTVTVVSGAYAFGYAFFPLIVSAAIRLLKNREQPIKFWELVLSITVLAQTHVLSLVLGLIVYALAFIVYIFSRKNIKAIFKTIKVLVVAALTVLVVNFNVYGAYIEVMHSNSKIISPFTPTQMYFNTVIDFGNISFASISGIVFIALLIAWAVRFAQWKESQLADKFALIVSLLFLLIAMGIININGIPGMTTFQFLTRFFLITFTFGLYSLGQYSEQNISKYGSVVLIVATIGGAAIYLQQTIPVGVDSTTTSKKLTNSIPPLDSDELTYQVYTRPMAFTDQSIYKHAKMPMGLADYLPNDSPFEEDYKSEVASSNAFNAYFSSEILQNNNFKGRNLERKVGNNSMIVSWTSNTGGVEQLPIIKYAHTELTLNGKKLPNNYSNLSYIGTVSVQSKKGVNTLKVSYKPSLWFVIGSWIQILGVLSIVLITGGYVIIRRFRV
ncbi:hypothetical protein ESZ50_00475 [Weissella muntiaci]|uniref:YfhO family protein n=1 Tax=Weissella muntiaci TaxID=2508881 RepID=A0A6C2CBR0_9LACO|nr:hypothetical protein [Weissella muntiaci]TYC51042.1 hypothetical protein ESZ50_00475 [Weissella muntiaci]